MSISIDTDLSSRFIDSLSQNSCEKGCFYGILNGKVVKQTHVKGKLQSNGDGNALRNALIKACTTLANDAKINDVDTVINEVRSRLGMQDDGAKQTGYVSGDQISDVIRTLQDYKVLNADAEERADAAHEGLSLADEFILGNCDVEGEIVAAKDAECEACNAYVNAAIARHVELQNVDEDQQKKVLETFDSKDRPELVSKAFLSGQAVRDAFTRELKNQLARHFRYNVAIAPKPANISEMTFKVLVARANQQTAIAVYSALAAVSDFRDELVEMVNRDAVEGDFDEGEKVIFQRFIDASDPEAQVSELLKKRLPPAKMRQCLLGMLDDGLVKAYRSHSTPAQRNASVRFEEAVKRAAQTALDKMHELTTQEYLNKKLENEKKLEELRRARMKVQTETDWDEVAKRLKVEADRTHRMWVKEYGETGLDVLLTMRKKMNSLRTVSLPSKKVDLFSSSLEFEKLDSWAKNATDTFKKRHDELRKSHPNHTFYDDFVRINNNKPWLSRITIDGKNLGMSWGVKPEECPANDKLLEQINKQGSLNPEQEAHACLLKLLQTVPPNVKNRDEIVFFLSTLNTLSNPIDDVLDGIEGGDFGLGSLIELQKATVPNWTKFGGFVEGAQWIDQNEVRYEYYTSKDKLTVVFKGTIGPNIAMGSGIPQTQFRLHLPRAQFETTIEIPFEKCAQVELDVKETPNMTVNMQIRPLAAESDIAL